MAIQSGLVRINTESIKRKVAPIAASAIGVTKSQEVLYAQIVITFRRAQIVRELRLDREAIPEGSRGLQRSGNPRNRGLGMNNW